MALTNCRSTAAHDGLSRDRRLHVSDDGSGPARKILIGVVLGLVLALAGILSGPPQSVDRFAPPESEGPPQIVLDRDGPWADAGR